jgi:hypothetical protein
MPYTGASCASRGNGMSVNDPSPLLRAKVVAKVRACLKIAPRSSSGEKMSVTVWRA